MCLCYVIQIIKSILVSSWILGIKSDAEIGFEVKIRATAVSWLIYWLQVGEIRKKYLQPCSKRINPLSKMIFNPQIHLCSLCHSPTFKDSERCRMLVLVLQQLGLWEAVRRQPGQPAGWVRVGVWILWPRVQCSSRYSLLLPAYSSRVSNQGRKAKPWSCPWHDF